MQGKCILRSYINHRYLLLHFSHQRLRPELYCRRPFSGSSGCVCRPVMRFFYDLGLGSVDRSCYFRHARRYDGEDMEGYA